MKFYYFVASLPALKLGEPSPLGQAEFRAEAARLLPPDAVAELEAVLGGDCGAARSGMAKCWFDAETQLRNAVATVRAGRLGVEAGPHLRPHRGFSASLEQAVNEAYGKPNPLERELALDAQRWNVADDLSRATPFGLEAVLAYGLKLRMVERWAGLQDEAGRVALQEAVQQVRDRARAPEAATLTTAGA